MRSRKGRSWLLVRIAGLGSRASIAMRGGGPEDVGDDGTLVELFLSKKPGLLPAATLGALSTNWCCLLAYASPSVPPGRGGSIGNSVKFATALGFSLNSDGLFTVTFTKYRISASPGKPVRDGGNVVLRCCVGALANSGIVFAKEIFVMGAVDC